MRLLLSVLFLLYIFPVISFSQTVWQTNSRRSVEIYSAGDAKLWIQKFGDVGTESYLADKSGKVLYSSKDISELNPLYNFTAVIERKNNRIINNKGKAVDSLSFNTKNQINHGFWKFQLLNGKYLILNEQQDFFLITKYQISQALAFKNGKILFSYSENGKTGLLDWNGSVMKFPSDTALLQIESSEFIVGKINSSFCLFDIDGKRRTGWHFRNVFAQGNANFICLEDSNGFWHVADTSFKLVNSKLKGRISSIANQYLITETINNGSPQAGIYSHNGNRLTQQEYKRITPLNDTLFIVWRDSLYYLVNLKEEQILPPGFTYIRHNPITNTVILETKSQEKFYYNRHLNSITKSCGDPVILNDSIVTNYYYKDFHGEENVIVTQDCKILFPDTIHALIYVNDSLYVLEKYKVIPSDDFFSYYLFNSKSFSQKALPCFRVWTINGELLCAQLTKRRLNLFMITPSGAVKKIKISGKISRLKSGYGKEKIKWNLRRLKSM